ncbi:putative 50S ribosomal subunit protein L28 [Babesia divergens]|uniref:Large ribosomal subunit protein bL28c n=1 Tax=Babesia divergens TaxID=32595 RepID=A0AAD9GFV8_BABDI|nr:putative 50S ribosomal subunit protein L28 [Babesia divergens]
MTIARHLLAIGLSISLIATLSLGFHQNPVPAFHSFAKKSQGGCPRFCHILRETTQGGIMGMSRHPFGRKFKSTGTSSQVRHFRIVGRGGGLPRLRKVSGMPTKRIELPARRCMLLGKMDNTKARQISHSGKRSHRTQKVNLQWKRIWCISKGHYVRLRLSMKGLKTIKRLGLEEAARRFHLNLNNPKLFAGYANLSPKKEKISPEFEETSYDEGTTDI